MQREDSLSLARRRLSLASAGRYGGNSQPLKTVRRRSRFSLMAPGQLLQLQSMQQMSGKSDPPHTQN